MLNPYKPAVKDSLKNKPFIARIWNRDFLTIASALSLLCLSPIALLLVEVFIPRNSPLPPGVWLPDSEIDQVVELIGLTHLILATASVVVIQIFSRKLISKLAITLLVIGSIPAMLFALLVITMSKTGKWLQILSTQCSEIQS